MKFLRITTLYPSYIHDFYVKHPGLAEKTFAEQKALLDYDAFGWADYWSHALEPLGYEVLEIPMNVEPLQRAWARENNVERHDAADMKLIILDQVKKFRPDILWFDDSDAELLKQIRYEVPAIRLVLGWSGSAIPVTDVWSYMDLVLSCAPETVATFQSRGVASAHLHHGFDPRILDRLNHREKSIDFSFIGQIVRGAEFHLNRELLLEQLALKTRLEIYSPSANLCWKEDATAFFKAAVYSTVRALRALGFSESFISSIPGTGRLAHRTEKPVRPINPKLKPFIRPAVFGLDMFQVLHDSKITLNIHADSSPLFASNMRLFEITGVGACMVTDWKQNLSELFEPGKEIIVYRTHEECVENVEWLLEHPKEREEIAQAGKARTMKDHSFSKRACILDRIIKKELN